MPRRCTVCAHPDREAIELAIVRNVAYRQIAPQYGLEETALRRHHRNHMTAPEPEPTSADLQRQRNAEHRERLKVERHHVIAGLLHVVKNADVGAATVSAWREIARLEAMYPAKEFTLTHKLGQLEKLPDHELARLEALDDDALIDVLGISRTGTNGHKRY